MALEPTQAELIREAIESRLLDVHTALPGIVESYDPTTQTGNIRLAVRRAIEGADGGIDHEEIPVLPNVPFGWFASGGFALQFPVSTGDTVWVMFSEAAWAGFRTTGNLEDPGDVSRFGLSYPVAIPICRPVTKTLTPIGANEAVLDVPTGKTLRVGGASAQLVALAPLVASALGALKTAIGSAATTEAGAGGTGGMTALNGALSAWPSAVAATKLKAE